MRRFIGNLNFEYELAREASKSVASASYLRLPSHLLEFSSALATLLRIFLREGDRLWTPHAVDPGRIARVPDLPHPVLETGPIEALPPCQDVLAWGETRATEALHGLPEAAGANGGETPPKRPEIRLLSGEEAWSFPYAERLWALPRSSAEAALRANDRFFCFELSRSLGVSLPGAAPLSSLGELEKHLAKGGAALSPERAWVLKAPFSCAGRLRAFGRGDRLEPAAAARAERLFEAFGRLLFEPWAERLADYGRTGLVGDDSVEILPPHVSIVETLGGYLGTEISLSGVGLSPDETQLSDRVISEVGARLHACGYRGPFTVDFWQYLSDEALPRLHPLGEINARFSFGLVAWAYASVNACAIGARRLRLRVDPTFRARIPNDALAVIPLLLPRPGGRGAAWLECSL